MCSVLCDESECIFTPYGTREEADRTMKLHSAIKLASLWTTKNHHSIRMIIARKMNPRLTEKVGMVMEMHIAVERNTALKPADAHSEYLIS